MHRRQRIPFFIAAVVLLFAVGALAQQPQHVSYQGQLEQNGVPFSGTAGFKFVVVSGTTTVWSHDGSSSSGSEPATSLSLTVETGMFSVLLGDAVSGQTPILPGQIWDAADSALRVWVDTGSGFDQLSDQPLSSALFALVAETANAANGDFTVPGNLDVLGTVAMTNIRITNAPVDGYVLTTDSLGNGSWQPGGGTGEADADWVVNGETMFALPSGNIGIGTGVPLNRLHVIGTARFDVGGGRLELATPGGWPGLISYSDNGHRRDIIFDDSGIRLLASLDANPPMGNQGLVINEQGWLGVGKIPVSNLDVIGQTITDVLTVDGPGFEILTLAGDATDGATANFYGGGGISDPGVSIQGAGLAGGGILDLYNGGGNATIDLQGDVYGAGAIYVSDSSGMTAAIDGYDGKFQAYNSSGTLTYEASGQAFGSSSQLRTYDANGLLCDEWTAAAREWKVWDDTGVLQVHSRGNTSGGELSLFQSDGQNGILFDGDSSGHGHINIYDDSGVASLQLIGQDSGGDSRVVVDVLEITGGSDLSESFDIGTDIVNPGMVVCIDAESPGQLVVSEKAYARTVAGVVSGAGGVKTGLLMGQRGSIADGEHPVALTGRVWTWCDATAGAITPGDLLTTSEVTGHAMRVDDHARSQGAVIGKAMSSLSDGRGLVLVLVSLQ